MKKGSHMAVKNMHCFSFAGTFRDNCEFSQKQNTNINTAAFDDINVNFVSQKRSSLP